MAGHLAWNLFQFSMTLGYITRNSPKESVPCELWQSCFGKLFEGRAYASWCLEGS